MEEMAKEVLNVLWNEKWQFSSINKNDLNQVFCINVNEMSIILNDGSWIKFIPANTNMRGQRFTDSFLIDDIDSEIVKRIIKPMTTMGNRGVWILNIANESYLWSSITNRRKWSKEYHEND